MTQNGRSDTRVPLFHHVVPSLAVGELGNPAWFGDGDIKIAEAEFQRGLLVSQGPRHARRSAV
jgi:hypothetical protein